MDEILKSEKFKTLLETHGFLNLENEKVEELKVSLLEAEILNSKFREWEGLEDFQTLLEDAGKKDKSYTFRGVKSAEDKNFRQISKDFRNSLGIEEELEKIEAWVFENTEGITYAKKDMRKALSIPKEPKYSELEQTDKDNLKKEGIKLAINTLLLTTAYDLNKGEDTDIENRVGVYVKWVNRIAVRQAGEEFDDKDFVKKYQNEHNLKTFGWSLPIEAIQEILYIFNNK